MTVLFLLTSRGNPAATQAVLNEVEAVRRQGDDLCHMEHDEPLAETLGWLSPVEKSEHLTVMYNRVFNHYRQDALLWLHPDMVFYPGWFDGLMSAFDEIPNLWYASSYNWRTPEPPAGPNDSFDDAYWNVVVRSPDATEAVETFRQENWTKYQIGASLPFCLKRSAWEMVGRYDENILGVAGWEDMDMQRRVWNAGGLCLTVCRSVVWHRGQAESRNLPIDRYGPASVINRNIFKYKHRIPFDSQASSVPEGTVVSVKGWSPLG